MAQVLLEGIYRIWVDVDGEDECEAFSNASDLTLDEIFDGKDSVSIYDIEDLQPVDYMED